ncbi:MAG: Nif3-like dinuclear metal center hexameric protein [Solirubrobacteraceae bacterium]
MPRSTPDRPTHNPDAGPEVREILDYLDGLLTPDEFEDYGPNGLQIPGAAAVNLVVTGVSGQLELFERARELGAELVIVHHGILWDFQPRRVSAQQAARLRTLLCADIALAAYHLPLDAHPAFGNNALLAERLGASSRTPFGMHRGRPIGVVAHFDGEGLPAAELFDRVRSVTGREPLVLGAGPELVRSLGIVSGAGADSLPEAVARGLDGLLTGEPREHVMADAHEAGVHFIAAGHYATETFGIRRLGELVAERFSIQHKFIDLANPV